MNIDFSQVGTGLLQSLPYILGVIVLPLVYKLFLNLMENRGEVLATRGNNTASAINRFGAYMGLVIAIGLGPLLGGGTKSYEAALGAFYLSGLISIVVFIVLRHVLDAAIVRNVNNAGLIRGGMVSVALTEAAAYIASGLVISGAFSGDGQSFWPGIGSAVLFSFLGVAVLSAAYYGYTKVWKWTRADVDKEIGEGDLVSAVDASSVLIAIGITLFFSIAGDFTGWWNDIVYFVIAVLSSTVLVPVGRYFGGVLISGLDSRSSELGRSLGLGAVTIGVGLVSGLTMFT